MKNVVRIVFDAVKLDIYSLNYVYSSDKMQGLLSIKKGGPRRGVIIRIASFLYHGFVDGSFQQLSIPKGHSTVLVFANSKNQQDALAPVVKSLPDVCFLGIRGFGEDEFPYTLAYIFSIPFFPLVYWKYLTSRGRLREAHKFAFELHWLTYGYYIVWRLVLRNISPRIILVSNDHNVWTRVLLQAAKHGGIKTSYLQHASVSERFPALSVDYAFLDGEDAILKYDRIGASTTKVFAVGITKFDGYQNFINTDTKLKSVGICVNLVDPPSRVEELCRHLVSGLKGIDFFLRPHPSDDNYSMWNTMALECGLIFSDSRKVSSFDFLKQVDAIVACESNIHLEAALLNVFPVYYDFPRAQFDNYGFVKNGMIRSICSTPDEVLLVLKSIRSHRPSVRNSARHYCATIGTADDGHSSRLVASLISDICSNENIDWTYWKPVENLENLTAFEPAGHFAKN